MLNHEEPLLAWNTLLDNKVLYASLPVLEESMPKSDTCHHDSGVNRHVFHDKTAFEAYEAIDPVAVKGFRCNLSTVAIGRGVIRVEGTYGSHKTPLCLHNVLHIPAACSNLISRIQLDKAGVTATSGNRLATLSVQGVGIVGEAIENDMYHLNLNIIHLQP